MVLLSGFLPVEPGVNWYEKAFGLGGTSVYGPTSVEVITPEAPNPSISSTEAVRLEMKERYWEDMAYWDLLGRGMEASEARRLADNVYEITNEEIRYTSDIYSISYRRYPVTLLQSASEADTTPIWPGAYGGGAMAFDHPDESCRDSVLAGAWPQNIWFVDSTSLGDTLFGSFQAAWDSADANGNACNFIHFRSGGDISKKSGDLDNTYENIYVAGQTAPGGGVLFRDGWRFRKGTVSESHDIAFRNVQWRSVGGWNLAILSGGIERFIVANSSFSWSAQQGGAQVLTMTCDTVLSGDASDGICQNWTAQENLIFEPDSTHATLSAIASTPKDAPPLERVFYYRNAHLGGGWRTPTANGRLIRVQDNVQYNRLHDADGALWTRKRGRYDYINLKAIPGPATSSGTFRRGAAISWYGWDDTCPDSDFCGNDDTIDHVTDSLTWVEGIRCENNNWKIGQVGTNDSVWTFPTGCFLQEKNQADSIVPVEYRASNRLLDDSLALLPPIATFTDSVVNVVVDSAGPWRQVTDSGGFVFNRNTIDSARIQWFHDSTGLIAPIQIQPNGVDVLINHELEGISTVSAPTPVAGTPPTDTDGDGMPDNYESRYSISNATADPDGDRWTNYEEYINGTDPTTFTFDDGSESSITLPTDTITFPGAVGGGSQTFERCYTGILQNSWPINIWPVNPDSTGTAYKAFGSMVDSAQNHATNEVNVIIFEHGGKITDGLGQLDNATNNCLYVAGQSAGEGGSEGIAFESGRIFLDEDDRDVVFSHFRTRDSTQNAFLVSDSRDIMFWHLSASHFYGSGGGTGLAMVPDTTGGGTNEASRVTTMKGLYGWPDDNAAIGNRIGGGQPRSNPPNDSISSYEDVHYGPGWRLPSTGGARAQVIRNVSYNWTNRTSETGNGARQVDWLGGMWIAGPASGTGALGTQSIWVTADSTDYPGRVIYVNNISHNATDYVVHEPDSLWRGTYRIIGCRDSWAKCATDGDSVADMNLARASQFGGFFGPQDSVLMDTTNVDRSTELQTVLDEAGAMRILAANGEWVNVRDEFDSTRISEINDSTGLSSTINSPSLSLPSSPSKGTAWTDSDLDGMPDTWESFYGISDNSLDPDQDGWPNLFEFLHGTDPTVFTESDGTETGGTTTFAATATNPNVYRVDTATYLDISVDTDGNNLDTTTYVGYPNLDSLEAIGVTQYRLYKIADSVYLLVTPDTASGRTPLDSAEAVDRCNTDPGCTLDDIRNVPILGPLGLRLPKEAPKPEYIPQVRGLL